MIPIDLRLKPMLSAILVAALVTGCKSDWKVDDADNDGFTVTDGDCWDSVAGPSGSTLGGRDIFPGAADSWYDGVDQDCAGDSDYDADLDGYDTQASGGADCDDTTADISPDAVESCDDIDNDCDGKTDDDDDDLSPPNYYADIDGDGYGDIDNSVVGESCEPTPGYELNSEDCNDVNPDVYPGAPELCDEIDQDCDGELRDDDSTDALSWCVDADEDGYGDPSNQVTRCAPESGGAPDGTTANDDAVCSDCDDDDDQIYPAAVEECDELDNDCDDEIDEAADAPLCYPDDDGDNYGSIYATDAVQACTCESGYTRDNSDCDDDRDDINPAAVEICTTAEEDEDCDGLTDDDDPSMDVSSLTPLYADDDADGYGDPDTETLSCSARGYIEVAGDCDDSNRNVYPGAAEICESGTVEDCDGSADDARRSCIEDIALSSPVLYGAAKNLAVGTAVAGHVDASGDGLADLIVTTPVLTTSSGAIYTFTATTTRSASTSSVSYLNRWTGAANNDKLGSAISTVEDIDGDGLDDLIGASPNASNTAGNTGAGAVYLMSSGSSTTAAVSTSTCLAVFEGAKKSDFLGTAVAGGGDWNDDGTPDIAAGAPYYNHATGSDTGAVWLISGTATSAGVTSAAYALIVSATTDEHLGATLSNGGDVDADGVSDLLIGAPGASADAGAIYLVEGPTTANILVPTGTIALYGAAAGDEAGLGLSGAGDADGDGYDDILIGAPGNDDGGTDAGAVYLVLGAASLSASLSLTAADATFTGGAAGDAAGTAVSLGGDIDDDGMADLIIGAPANDDSAVDAGAVYLVFGPASSSGALSGADMFWTGVVAADGFGTSVAGIGDTDGDGFGEILIGATGYDFSSYTGAGGAYLLRGSSY